MWHSWRRSKTVGILAAAALAVGIGATTAIYTVVNAVMIAPLPYQHADRFVALFGAALNDPEHYASLSYRDAQAFQERSRSFDAFGWFRDSGKNLTFAGEPYHVKGVSVTTALMHELGVSPMIGRWFDSLDSVVLSSALWRRLGGDPAIVGRSLTLDGRPYTVAGVMPESFRFPAQGITDAGLRVDVWLPLDRREADVTGVAYFAYARRRPDVSLAAADADVKRVAAQIAAESPADHQSFTARLFDLRESVIKDVRPTLLLVFAASGLLFVITCANAAGLVLARTIARSRDTAVRVAIGAGRRHLARQFLLEALPLALAGAAGGLALSTLLTPRVLALAEDYLPRAGEIGIDWRVLLFAAIAAAATMLVAGLAPLVHASRTNPADVLTDGARGSAGVRSRGVSTALVVGEIALAFALLAASGVLLLHLQSLMRLPRGFDPEDVLTFTLSIPGRIANDQHLRAPLQRRIVESLRAIPGVEDAAISSQLLLNGCCMGTSIYPEGRVLDPRVPQRNSLTAVSPEYFHTMRIALRHGRLLTERDQSASMLYALVDRTAAMKYWNRPDPVGAYGRFSTPTGDRFQVVGVVDDVKNDGLGNATVPTVYILSSVMAVESMHVTVRSSRPVASLIPDVRRVIRGIDREQPIDEIATMNDIVRGSVTLERAASVLTGFFAAAALLMATLGVYGILSYAVRQRTAEIGTRMALGATRAGVLGLIVTSGLRMALAGVVLGGVVAAVAAVYLGRAFDIGTLRIAPFVYSASIVAAVAVLAAAVPGWRAATLSPLSAIRDS